MAGVAVVLVLSAALAGFGDLIARRWTSGLDPALRWGVAALIGMGAFGFALWVAGMTAWLPLQTSSLALTAIFAVAGVAGIATVRRSFAFSRPTGWGWAALAMVVSAVLMAVLAAAGPSDSLDWDSLAYHLAVPKIWLAAGRIEWIGHIHHSNFPYLVDSLFLAGLALGGAAAAKGFMAAYFLWGSIAVFGAARSQWGAAAGWWAALAFVGIPTALWESGTAYIDVAHGLYAGLGTWFVSRWIADRGRRSELAVGCALLGCAVASKYTGLQTVAACCLALAFTSLGTAKAEGLRAAAIAAVVSLGIAAPWLIKNEIWAGNPVYPFFYEQLGGKNWDEFSARIYREEQQSFGVGLSDGRRDPAAAGAAVLGLAYQPGRYVNPRQTEGGGFPTGSLGWVPLAAAVAWCFAGRRSAEARAVLAIVGISLAMWFALSQQSRYLLNLGIPLAILAGGAAVRLPTRPWLMGAILLQLGYSLWMVHTLAVGPKLAAALGRQTEEEYRKERGPSFYFAAQRLNDVAQGGRVAIFDEVFGWFLDVPYFWANPGHSTEMGYARLDSGDEFADALSGLEITHAYLSLAYLDRNSRDRWLATAGLTQGEPYSSAQRAELAIDLRSKWRLLFADAVAGGRLKLVEPTPGGLIFELREEP